METEQQETNEMSDKTEPSVVIGKAHTTAIGRTTNKCIAIMAQEQYHKTRNRLLYVFYYLRCGITYHYYCFIINKAETTINIFYLEVGVSSLYLI